MKFNVTQKNIDTANRYNPNSCAVAKSHNDIEGVCYGQIIMSDGRSFAMPRESFLSKWLVEFDFGFSTVKPITVTLDEETFSAWATPTVIESVRELLPV